MNDSELEDLLYHTVCNQSPVALRRATPGSMHALVQFALPALPTLISSDIGKESLLRILRCAISDCWQSKYHVTWRYAERKARYLTCNIESITVSDP